MHKESEARILSNRDQLSSRREGSKNDHLRAWHLVTFAEVEDGVDGDEKKGSHKWCGYNGSKLEELGLTKILNLRGNLSLSSRNSARRTLLGRDDLSERH